MVLKAETPILSVKNLKKYYHSGHRGLNKAVDGISFSINPGETFGLVGESGSGKSTTGRTIIRLETPTEGEIQFLNEDLSRKLNKPVQQWLRTKMQMIFQDPMASLNPRRNIFKTIEMGLKIHHLASSDKVRKEKVFEMLHKVGLSEDYAYCYPQDLSGGQRQRVGIARALIVEPDLIIADEPISALDVSIQAQIVNLMKDIQTETGTAYLFIAHDLSMVHYLSDRIGVMHLGHLVEIGTSNEIFHHAKHPYTQCLLSAIPTINPEFEKTRTIQSYQNPNARADYVRSHWVKLSETHSVLQ